MNRVIKLDNIQIAKEESRELQRLLNESYIRLQNEYEKNGGMSLWQYVWYLVGYIV